MLWSSSVSCIFPACQYGVPEVTGINFCLQAIPRNGIFVPCREAAGKARSRKPAANASKARVRAINKGMKTNENTEPLRRFNPLNDFLFHKTMGVKGNEPQLIGFLNAVLVPSGRKPIDTVEILDKKIYVKDIISGKSCSLDVRAALADGSRVNIEVQVRDKKNMDRRSLFYWGKMYAETLQSGDDYRDLPDTIAINIVGYDFPDGGGAHTRFRLREVTDPTLELTGAMEIHFLNVVKWRRQVRKDFSGDPLHRWLAWLDPESPPETIEEVKSMDIAIAHADGRQRVVMRGRRAREAYEATQKAEMDRRSEIAFAVEAAVADRDAVVAEKEAEIERLRALLGAGDCG